MTEKNGLLGLDWVSDTRAECSKNDHHDNVNNRLKPPFPPKRRKRKLQLIVEGR